MGVFSTRYHMLGREIAAEFTTGTKRKSLGVYQMAAYKDEQGKQIIFLYKFQQGICGGRELSAAHDSQESRRTSRAQQKKHQRN